MKLTEKNLNKMAEKIAFELVVFSGDIEEKIKKVTFDLICIAGIKKGKKVNQQVKREIKIIENNIKNAKKIALQIGRSLKVEEDKRK